MFAIDGSGISIPCNPDNKETYIKQGKNRGYNLLHLNAMYDLCNQVYTDAIIQPQRELNEYTAFTQMVDRSKISDRSLVIADRGYKSYNLFAYVEQKGWKYLIRVRDKTRTSMLNSFDLPTTDEFDSNVNIILTKRYPKKKKANNKIYKYVPSNSNFDYLDSRYNLYYPISFRVIRMKHTKRL